MIVLISESMLRRSRAVDGRLLRDTVLCGFCVRMNPRKRAFKVATSVAGKQFRMTLGYWPLMSVEEARAKAMEVLRECRAGRVPSKAVVPVRPTVRAALDAYCAAKGIKESSKKRYDSLMRTHFSDWLDRSVGELGSQSFSEHCHVEWANDRANAVGMDVEFLVDNVVHLSTCGDARFDLVVDGHCLHCIIGEDRATCLAAVYRVLKPGGSFVVLTMCGEVTNQKMLKSFDLERKVTLHQGQPTRYIGDVDAIVSEVTATGFVAESVRVVPRKDADDLDNLIVRARKPI